MSARFPHAFVLRLARKAGLARICLVNAVHLDPAANGGVSRVAREICRALVELRESHMRFCPVFAVNAAFADRFPAWLGAGATVVPVDPLSPDPLLIDRLKPDLIVHALFGVEPFAGLDGLERVRQIAVMPDALALDCPHYFDAQTLALRMAAYRQLAGVDHLITLSEHARGRLLAHLARPADSVIAIPLGADAVETDNTARSPLDPTLRYLLYPANNWPHKRHALLMQVFARLSEHDPSLHLVLTGGRVAGTGIDPIVLAATCGLAPERVHDLGYVDDATLATLYAGAYALVFVSGYEGFGMPLLEAMLRRCPVVCSDHSSIPEVAGDAALYIRSDDPDAWARAILEDLPRQRAALVTRGEVQAAQFTWARTRARYRDWLRQAAPQMF